MFEDLPKIVGFLQFVPNMLMVGGLLVTPVIMILGLVAIASGDRASQIVLPTLVVSGAIHVFSIVYAAIPLFFLSGLSDVDQLRIRKFEVDLLMPSIFCAAVFFVSSYIAWQKGRRRVPPPVAGESQDGSVKDA